MEIKRESIEKYINGLTKETLIEEMILLSDYFSEVYDYFSYRVDPDINADLLSKYEDLVELALKNGDFATCDYRVDTFMKITNQKEAVVELKLFYAEMAIGYSNEMSRVSSTEIHQILKSYERVLQYVCEIDAQEQYDRRLRELIGFGTASDWHIAEGLQELYNQYYNVEED